MKFPFISVISIFFFLSAGAQNTGINTNNPQQTLDVNGAVKIGSSTNNQAGSIRYNSGNFEGADGTSWKPLGVPSKSIIISRTPDTASIKAAGFSVLKQMDIWDTITIPVTTNYAGSWSNLPVSGGVTPAFVSSSDCVSYNNQFIYFGSDAYLYDYDVSTQVWSKLPNISPLGTKTGSSVVLVGTDVYVMGGWQFVSGFNFYNAAYKYSLVSNTWTAIANIPVNVCYALSAVIGTDIYLLNGAGSYTAGVGFNYSKKMYKYNTLTNTWAADLSVAATPSFLNQGMAAVWNNKLVYNTTGAVINSYDPTSHAIASLSIGVNGETFAGGLHTINGNKLYVLAVINDSTNISYVPGTYQQENYEVDLISGAAVKLSVCNLVPGSVSCYKYHPNAGKIISLGTTNTLFDRTGTQQCDVVLRRQGYWYYMKKN